MASWYFFSSIYVKLRSAYSSTLKMPVLGGLLVAGVLFIEPLPLLIGGRLLEFAPSSFDTLAL